MQRKLKIIVLMVCFSTLFLTSCTKKNNTLIFADAGKVWWLAPTTIAKEDSLFNKHGLDVQTFDVTTGLASKNAVLSGSADIGMVASTPLAMGAYTNESIVILCCYVESDKLLSVQSRKKEDGSILSKETAVQEQVAIVPSTISEFYLYRYLEKFNPTLFEKKQNNKLSEVHLRPPDVVNSMKANKKVNSAVIWEPFGKKMSTEANIEEFREGEIYNLSLYLITRPDVLKSKSNEIEQFVNAVKEASNLIESSKKMEIDKVRMQIEDLYDYETGWLLPLWFDVDFTVKDKEGDIENMQRFILEDAEIAFQLGKKEKPLKKEDIAHLFNYMNNR